MDKLLSFIDSKLPASVIARDEDVKRRARLVLMFAWALTALAPIFVSSDLKNGRWQNAAIILAAVPFGLSAAAVFRWTRSLVFMAHYIAAVFGGVLMARSLMTGGITAYAPFWMSALPVIAALLANRKAGLVWLGVDVVFFVSVFIGTKAGVQWADAWTPVERQKEFVIATSLLAVLMLTLGSLFEVAKERMRHGLARREEDIKRMLDVMGQGFLTVSTDGRMVGPWSSVLERWFGVPLEGATLADYLRPHDARGAQWVELAFASLKEDVLPFELIVEQFPRHLDVAGRRFAFQAKPVFSKESLTGLVAVITDVTAEAEQERAAQEQREVLQVMDKALNDRRGFLGFFTEAERLMAAIVETGSLRDVHTLKGNAALFGALTVSAVAHEVETATIDLGEVVVPSQSRRQLQEAWSAFASRVKVLVQGRGKTVEVPVAEVDALRAGLEHREAHAALQRQVDQWLSEPVRQPLERLGAQARALAVRLGKLDPQIVVDDGGLRVRPEQWSPIWAVMAHLVRNAVDHGLDEAQSRLEQQKPARPTIRFAARATRDGYEVSISDDGRGVNWQVVAAQAKARGLPAATQADLEAALFSDGFSTAREVTDLSGRGVGLSAVAALCRELHGHLAVSSQTGQGATFTLTLGGLAPALRAA